MENHRIRRFLQKEANAAKLNASLKDDQQNITSDLGNLLNNMKLSDFKFTVHGDDFHVHKAILAARSPVFMTMFSGEFQESKANAGKISNVSKEAFKDFLRYLYTDSVLEIKNLVIELLELADYYEVKGLKTLCEAELMSGLTEENSADIFLNAHLYRCEKPLKEAAFRYIKASFARNSFTIPDEFIDLQESVRRAVDTKKEMEKILGSNQATNQGPSSKKGPSELNGFQPPKIIIDLNRVSCIPQNYMYPSGQSMHVVGNSNYPNLLLNNRQQNYPFDHRM